MIFKKVKKFIYRTKCELMYRKAKAAAIKMASKDGDIYYVLPMESGKLMVINKSQYMAYRKAGLTPKDGKPKDIFRDCVYHTRAKSKNAQVSRKRKFLRWKGLE